MITINPIGTRTSLRKTLLLSAVLATATLTSCVNSNKHDTFEKQKTELSYSSNIKPGANPDNFKAIKMAEKLEQSGKGELEVEKYGNGKVKSKTYDGDGWVELDYDTNGYLERSYVGGKNIRQEDYYYPNGNLRTSKDNIKLTYTEYYEDGTPKSYKRYIKTSVDFCESWKAVEEIKYCPNGKKEYHWFEDKGKETSETFYENGNPKTCKVEKGGFTVKEEEYNENGKPTTSITRKKDEKEVVKTYYPNGELKSKTVYKWELYRKYDEDGGYKTAGGWVETKHIEYDANGNKTN